MMIVVGEESEKTAKAGLANSCEFPAFHAVKGNNNTYPKPLKIRKAT